MTSSELMQRLAELLRTPMPLPGRGDTPLRHSILMEVAREDLALGRLAEAHWDAVAILAEAGMQPKPDSVYGVWASEKPTFPIQITRTARCMTLTGTKMFCSGAGLVDRALVTAGGGPEPLLIDIDLKQDSGKMQVDASIWKTTTFAATKTAAVTFSEAVAHEDEIVGEAGWYLRRPGFWHGACGPAACWAGGAISLVDYAKRQSRDDPHTMAHLGAMTASAWALSALLAQAGREIDEQISNAEDAMVRALLLRHLIEQNCTDILRRLVRAYGPHPLALDESIGRRYLELDLYMRQSHAERDLEAAGRAIHARQRS